MKEFVSFFLSGKKYGADIEHMQGIERFCDMVSVTELPDCLHGLIDIRGELIPVVDIRKHLVLPPSEVTDLTKYIIFRTKYGRMACRIDGVSNILKAEDKYICEIPELTQTGDTGYLDCVVKYERELVLIINPDNLLSKDDWKKVQEMFRRIEEEKREKERREREKKEQEKRERENQEREQEEEARKEND